MAKSRSITRAAKIRRATVSVARGQRRARPTKLAPTDALLQSHKELLALFEASPLAIHAMNADGIVIQWNPTAERIFGWSAREAIGQPLPFVPPEKRDEFLALFQRTLRGEVCSNVEVSRRRKDGTPIEISVSVAPLRDTQGRIVGAVSLNADITERKRLEARAKAMTHRLQTILAGQHFGILVVDGEGRVEYVNDTLVAQFGLSQTLEELRGCPSDKFIALVAPAYADPVALVKLIQETVARNVTCHGVEIKMRDGQVLMADFIPLFYEGRPAGRMWVHRDITSHKQAEAELRRMTRLYATLSRVNYAIVHVRTEAELLQEACRAAVDQGGFKLAWVGQYEPKTHAIVPVIRYGSPGQYVDTLRISADNGPLGQGPTGRAFREGKLVFCNDLANEPRVEPWRESQQVAELLSSAGVPIHVGGQLWGVLTVYSGEKNFFRKEETSLLEEMAQEVSFAMDYLTKEGALRKAEEMYRQLVEEAPNGIFRLDEQGNFIFVNSTICQMLGYTREELLQRNILDTYPAAEQKRGRQRLAAIRKGVIKSFERLMVRQDGSTFAVHVNTWQLEQGHIQAIVQDITERRQAEERMSAQLAELRRWQDVILDHEERVQELKQEVNALCRRLGEPVRYASQESVTQPGDGGT